MSLSFTNIPLSIRTPGTFVEIDASRAQRGLPSILQKILVIGLKLTAGTATAGALTRVQTVNEAKALFGRGSMLARMIAALKAVNDTLEIWALPLAEAGGGVAASGTWAFSGPATAAGTIYGYVAGTRFTVAVASGDTATAVGTAVAAAITALPDLPVTAAADTGTVTLTARHKGTAGNDIDMRFNYYDGEALPAGITCVTTAMASGATNPSVSSVFTAIGDAWFPTMVTGLNDATNMALIEAELLSRWGPLRMIEGICFAGARGTLSGLTTLGAARNSPFTSIIGAKLSPSSPCEWAAAFAAAVAASVAADPARPFQTLPLSGILPPAPGDRFTRAERDSALVDGISTFTVDASGVVVLERPITTYQTNGLGYDDTAYLDINTVTTVAYLRYSLRQRIGTKYPRHKLGDVGGVYGPGSAVVTVDDIRAEMIALFKDWQLAGLVEDIEQFKRDLVVERDPGDPSRVNAVVPPNTINQLRIVAAQLQFIL